jgi:hypothetical protein
LFEDGAFDMVNNLRVALLTSALAAGVVVASLSGCSSDSTKKRVAPRQIGGSAGETDDGAGAGGELNAERPDAGGSAGAAESAGGEGGVAPGSAGAAGESAHAAGAAGEGGAMDSGCESDAKGSRIQIEFDPADAERVTNLRWTDSASSTTANLAAAGGSLTCNDPLEFFGQAYGAEGTLPAPIVAGNRATLVRCGFDATITSAANDCTGASQFPVVTEYHAYAGVRANELRVTRTFGFGQANAVFPQAILRAYVPRLPVATFSSVIYPNQAANAVTVGSPGGCPTDCIVPTGTTWNGRWYADVDPTSGRAMIVVRDSTLTSAVNLALNNDSLSASNLSAFMLLAPVRGFTQPVTEIEYLCFADLSSWPQADRDSAQLPAGCGP